MLSEGDASVAEGSENDISKSSEDFEAKGQRGQKSYERQSDPMEAENSEPDIVHNLKNSIIVFCCENALHLYFLNSVIQVPSCLLIFILKILVIPLCSL